MNWLTRLFEHGPATTLAPTQQQRLEVWSALPPPDLGRSHFDTRYVVLNVQADGLDAELNTPLAVAAIAVQEGRILPAASLYVDLAADGPEALLGLLEFLRKDPVVAFNAPFHRLMLGRATQATLGIAPALEWIDLYWLLPALFPERHADPVRLAEWAGTPEVAGFPPHHALADAFLAAQLLLPALSAAIARSAPSTSDLIETIQQIRLLRRAP